MAVSEVLQQVLVLLQLHLLVNSITLVMTRSFVVVVIVVEQRIKLVADVFYIYLIWRQT